MSKLYVSKKQGIFIYQCEAKIPELKTGGVVLRHVETGEIIVISIILFKSKFKEIKKFTIDELK